jgi:hypothetical protein
MNEQGSDSSRKLQPKSLNRRNLIRGTAGAGTGLLLGSGLPFSARARDGFRFVSDPAKTTVNYAQIGSEANGSFFIP